MFEENSPSNRTWQCLSLNEISPVESTLPPIHNCESGIVVRNQDGKTNVWCLENEQPCSNHVKPVEIVEGVLTNVCDGVARLKNYKDLVKPLVTSLSEGEMKTIALSNLSGAFEQGSFSSHKTAKGGENGSLLSLAESISTCNDITSLTVLKRVLKKRIKEITDGTPECNFEPRKSGHKYYWCKTWNDPEEGRKKAEYVDDKLDSEIKSILDKTIK